MKKMMLILGLLLAVSVSQAATLAWGSGATVIKNEGGVGNLTGALVQLYFGEYGTGTLVDSTLTSNISGFKGTFADTVNYAVGTYPAGTTFYMLVYDNGAGTGNPMLITADGINNTTSPTYFTLTSVTDADSQSLALSDNGFPLTIEFTPIPEPTSLALIALGIAALGLRRKA